MQGYGDEVLLQQLVDDILLMQECKLDADQMEPTALEDVVRQAVSRAASAPEPREIRVQWPAQRCWVMAQPEYLIKALANLLDNALKFDPAGHPVDVAVGDQGDAWEVRVSDQGIGIPAGELDKVFERFYQVDGSTTRRFGGVGLGLAVAKEIVEAHGGHIWVQSAPGAGSTFGVVLPKASGHTQPSPL